MTDEFVGRELLRSALKNAYGYVGQVDDMKGVVGTMHSVIFDIKICFTV